jgi:hypothetical protein
MMGGFGIVILVGESKVASRSSAVVDGQFLSFAVGHDFLAR